jgi:hypothetical protein
VRDFLIKLTFASQWRRQSRKVRFQESLLVTSERKSNDLKKDGAAHAETGISAKKC